MKGAWQVARRPAWALALLVLCAFWFAVYSGTLSVNHEYDSLSYALDLERGRPLYLLFHPHHLIYNWLGRQWYLLLTWLGFHQGRAMVPGQLLDCLIGSLGLGLFWTALRRVTGDPWVPLVAALGLGSCFGYWHASTILAVRVLNGFSLILVFACLPAALRGGTRALVLLGLAHGFSILCHQTNALLTPAILVTLLAHLPGSFSEDPLGRLGKAGLVLLCATALASAVYLFVGVFIWLRQSPPTFVTWLFSYLGVHEWTRQKANALPQALFGWGTLFLGPIRPEPAVGGFRHADIRVLLSWVGGLSVLYLVLKGLWLARARAGWATLACLAWLGMAALARALPLAADWTTVLAAAAALALLGFTLWGWNLASPPRGWVLLFCALWLAAYVPFFYWWEPWNVEFWLSCLPPLFILMALSLSDLALLVRPRPWNLAWKGGLVALLACCVGLLFLSNLRGKVAFDGQAANNRYYNMLRAVDRAVRPRDLLVVLGDNGVPMYLTYFQPKRRVLSFDREFKRFPDRPERAFPEVEKRLKLELKRHDRVFLLNEVVNRDRKDEAYFSRNFGLPPTAVRGFVEGLKLKPVKLWGFKEQFLYRMTGTR